MARLALIALTLIMTACSSGGSVEGKSLSELRAACKEGRAAACRATKQHDQML